MPRHFTEDERIELRKKLLETATELFLHYGINKTTVADITEKAGVGKGTFYLFFKSKGDIYIQLYSDEWEQLHKVLDNKYMNKKGDISSLILDYIFENRRQILSHPLLSIVYTRNALAIISEPSVTQQLEKFRELSDSQLVNIIKSWFVSNGIKSSVKPETISGMMRSLSYLNYHKDEIGENIFDDVIKNFACGITLVVDQNKE